jgi:oligoendopeptidase F
MKKLIAILILLCMLTSLVACNKKNKPGNDPTNDPESEPTTEEEKKDPEPPVPTIIVPEYKDYGRGTVDFSTITYTRPGIEALIASFEALADEIKNGDGEVSTQIESIRSLEAPLSDAKTMYALVKIGQSKNTSSEFWQGESVYMGTYYPALTQAVEKLLVACANSENKSVFESDYFGYSIDEYIGGGIYTDEAVRLMQEEATLEGEYSSLSTATVQITYTSVGLSEPITGTVDEVKNQLKEHYGNNTTAYNNALIEVNNRYRQKLGELTKPIYIELVKVRRLIADELGYNSYTELAYGTLGYDYSSSEMVALLGDVGEYVYAVTYALTDEVFSGYDPQKFSLDSVTLMNTLYEVYSEMGGSYKDAYSYMLQHGLYSVSAKEENRYNGAFTEYLYSNASPYIFASTSSTLSDYTLIAHEFGHFLDAYINYGSSEGQTVAEISAQTMELLTLLSIKNTIYSTEYKYLNYLTVSNYLYDLLSYSFTALFEQMVYSLSYDEITEEKLEELVDKAYSVIYEKVEESPSLSNQPTLVTLLTKDTVLSPCSAESYISSTLVSIDIFFTELEATGAGFTAYEAFISRDEIGLTLEERLANAGIESIFAEGRVKEIANDIYHYMTGKSFTFDEDAANP